MIKSLVRKLIFIILILCISTGLYSANSKGFSQVVYGFVSTINDLSVVMDNTILPFNLLSDAVTINTDTSTVRGLKFGTVSFSSNDTSFALRVSHDKLKSDSPDTNGVYSELDYRLDVFYSNNTEFVSCTAGQTAIINRELNPTVFDSSPYIANGQSLYVSMNENSDTIEAAVDGTYSSTITFELTIGS